MLDAQFGQLIDMSDCVSRHERDQRQQFLSRALAALCVKSLASTTPEHAAEAVTDGFQDGGIDAIHFDPKSDTLFFVQSKWSESGKKNIDEQAMNAFIAGVRDVINQRFEKFNDKISSKSDMLRAILFSERDIKMRLVTIHTAAQQTAPYVLSRMELFLEELNDPVTIAYGENYDQNGVYELVTAESKAPYIKLQVGLNNWGSVSRPFVSYYGFVDYRLIAQWWREHRNLLFGSNLRLFYENSDVNSALRRTLENEPYNFWYFNNGVTIIADSISKSLVAGDQHRYGVFNCEGASIVNGAQTVGTIGVVFGTDTKLDVGTDDVSGPWVQVRLISLENCPTGFARRLTRAANLQNAVGNREFAAMDPVQHRLAIDLALDRRRYAYKQGEADPRGDEGCSIVEATQALACYRSVSLAVQVKREIGALWADTDAQPYIDLFNDSLTSLRLWRSVLVMRAVENELQKAREFSAPRAEMIAVHMNRIILHIVFQNAQVGRYVTDAYDVEPFPEHFSELVRVVFERVASYLNECHPADYLASLSKNARKCELLAEFVIGELSPKKPESERPRQGSLFDLLD